MRYQHKGPYIALKLGGAVMATVVAGTSFVYLKRPNELKAEKDKAFFEPKHETSRLHMLNQEYDRQ